MVKRGDVLKSYAKAEIYAAQKGVECSGPGWGYNVTPKQRKRLQRTHNRDMRKLLLGHVK